MTNHALIPEITTRLQYCLWVTGNRHFTSQAFGLLCVHVEQLVTEPWVPSTEGAPWRHDGTLKMMGAWTRFRRHRCFHYSRKKYGGAQLTYNIQHCMTSETKCSSEGQQQSIFPCPCPSVIKRASCWKLSSYTAR